MLEQDETTMADSVSPVTQLGIPGLLDQAGARPRGNRHDCPKCGGLRTITHTEECFYCHKCGWKGNAVTLQKELGIYQRIPSAEYRELMQTRERTHEAALRLYTVAHKRQLELREVLRELGRLELRAHESGPTEEAWGILADVYAKRPVVEVELDMFESGDAEEIYSFLRREV